MCQQGSLTILVVGNFPTTSLTGHQVTTESDYDAGIKILEEKSFDVIIIGAVKDTTKRVGLISLARSKRCGVREYQNGAPSLLPSRRVRAVILGSKI
ncbi:MAG: hypothetical protein RLZZ70_243 [Candidatus Parcubacteria bacterium]|jgi:hypothetical protein